MQKRQIKFKAWIYHLKLLIDVKVFSNSDGIECYLVNSEEGDRGNYLPEEYHLLQFTELLDSKENELYDQDVVEWVTPSLLKDDIISHTCLIEYDSKEFCGWVLSSKKQKGVIPLGKYGAKLDQITRIGSNLELKLL